MTISATVHREDFARLAAYLTGWLAEHGTSVASLREGLDAAERAIALPDGMTSVPWSTPGLSGQFIRGARTAENRILLFLHGGGYHYGSSRSHRHLAAAIAGHAACDALVLDYRLAPEHTFPAALEDALAAYRKLLASLPAERIAFAGDSAGGGLALATAVAAREAGLPTPRAIICMSPWLDLTCRDLTPEEASMIDDPISSVSEMRGYAASYLGGAPPDTPGASPLFADLRNLPPIYVQAGSREILIRDALALASAAPSSIRLEIEADAPHVWQWFWPRLPAAREAVQRLGRFLGDAFM
jgi:acetyl esterase/lipase